MSVCVCVCVGGGGGKVAVIVTTDHLPGAARVNYVFKAHNAPRRLGRVLQKVSSRRLN